MMGHVTLMLSHFILTLPHFHPVSRQLLVGQRLKHETFQENEAIYQHQDEASRMYILRKGKVQLSSMDAVTGKEIPYETISTMNTAFGEAAIFNSESDTKGSDECAGGDFLGEEEEGQINLVSAEHGDADVALAGMTPARCGADEEGGIKVTAMGGGFVEESKVC